MVESEPQHRLFTWGIVPHLFLLGLHDQFSGFPDDQSSALRTQNQGGKPFSWFGMNEIGTIWSFRPWASLVPTYSRLHTPPEVLLSILLVML